MSASETSLRTFRRNLFIFALARGAMFWYAIEKLFELHIGFSFQTIVLIGIIAQGSKIIFELPTSVVADRWSRRNTLLSACATSVVASITLGLSHTFSIYLVGTVLWALSDALFSGVYEAFVYDGLVAIDHEGAFRSVYTRMKSLEYVSIALAGLAAGLLGQLFGYSISFFLSAGMTAFAGFLLWQMQEPPIARTTDLGLTWLHHMGGAIAIMRKPVIRWTVLMYGIIVGFQSLWFEYYQLVGINVKTPTWLFGSLIAVLTLGLALGMEVAHKYTGTPRSLLVVWLVIMGSHLLGLQFTHFAPALLNLVIVFLGIRLLIVYLEIFLHQKIESSRRATIMSLASSLSYACFFVFAGIFSWALKHVDARHALLIASLPLLLLGLIDISRRLRWVES